MTNYSQMKINECSVDQHEALANGPNPLCVMHVQLPNNESGWIAGRDGVHDNALVSWLQYRGQPAESRDAAITQYCQKTGNNDGNV